MKRRTPRRRILGALSTVAGAFLRLALTQCAVLWYPSAIGYGIGARLLRSTLHFLGVLVVFLVVIILVQLSALYATIIAAIW